MRVLPFLCFSGCSDCCRYKAVSSDEFISDYSDFYGLRLVGHVQPQDRTIKGYFLDKSLYERFPFYETQSGVRVYLEYQFIEAGAYQFVYKKCREIKHVSKGDGCLLGVGKPLYCKAKPFRPALPLFIQNEALALLSEAQGCQGGISKKGFPILAEKNFLLKFSNKNYKIIDEEKNLAFEALQLQQKKWKETFSIATEYLIQKNPEDFELFCSNVQKNLFRFYPVTAFLFGAYACDMLSREKIFDIFTKQKQSIINEQIYFGEKFGEKTLFPIMRNIDNTDISPRKKDFFTRCAVFTEEYNKNIEKFTNTGG